MKRMNGYESLEEQRRRIDLQREKYLEDLEKYEHEIDSTITTISNDDLLRTVLEDHIGDDYDGGRTDKCNYRLGVYFPELLKRLKENKFITESYINDTFY